MSTFDINPFQVLYVTDSPDPYAFVRLFSDYPVKFSQMIFQPGNAVLKGTQGSGKSMLLNLLRPEIRLAYHQAGVEFPVVPELRRFVSAGINLTLSGALDIGQRPLGPDPDGERAIFPLLFADFLNYYVVLDLLSSLSVIGKNPTVFDHVVDASRLDEFAIQLARDDCWFGHLNGIKCFTDLESAIQHRVSSYRSFHQFNSDLPPDIQRTKTRIGAPMAAAHDALKVTGAMGHDVQLYVRIDQLERLYRSDMIRRDLGTEYRRIVNKVIGQRDSRVSYRIGTRRYAWEDDLTVFGTQDQLEELRDFRVVDLESQLRRLEDRKSWIFPAFAEDAFRRRLENVGYKNDDSVNLIRKVFGVPPSAEDAARLYAGSAQPLSILRLNKDWHSEWEPFLRKTFAQSPLEAVLANAWAMQRGGGSASVNRKAAPPPKDSPWEKVTWRKERIRQCLMQIAARNSQRLRWSGDEAIIGISSPNISIFLSVCHEIWDAFVRVQHSRPANKRTDPVYTGIGPEIQAVGIQTASNDWFKKIAEQPHGHDRQRFVDVLGRLIRQWLLDDDSMSNPGHVGFSLIVEELRGYPALKRFLDDASDYGDLYDADHTTKEKNRKQRTKWYLSPILSPHFQIPETHPKEPRYETPEEVGAWAADASVKIDGIPLRRLVTGRKVRPDQPTLFDSNGSDDE